MTVNSWRNDHERTDKLREEYVLTPYGIVALRWTLALYWGVHWCYKVLYQGMPATEHLFVSLGYPAWFAWGDITLEVIAVIGLVLGLYVRTLSLLLLVILIPAMALWIPNGIWAIHGGYEFPLLWIFLQFILALLGPGAMSIKTLPWLDALARSDRFHNRNLTAVRP